MRHVAGLIFHAPLGASQGERLVEAARWAAARGLARLLRSAGLDEIYVITPSAEHCPGGSERVEFLFSPKDGFHFGNALLRIIAERRLDGVVYFGSGAGGLLSREELEQLIQFARSEVPRALFNNFYSCDFCAIAAASYLDRVTLPAIDNPLGFALADAGFPCFALPRDAATQFDLDTPIDVLLAARSGRGNDELRMFYLTLDRTHPTLDRALATLVDRAATTCLVGRVNPLSWSHFESQVACRTSALVEGRGMRAGTSPRTPWIRQALVDEGPECFFDRLEQSCDSAWIDTRPLLADADSFPPAADRFASDLFAVDEVANPQWRTFADAAQRASIPVVLGGHSLVSGGLYLAAEACWKGRNLLRRLHPNPYEWKKE